METIRMYLDNVFATLPKNEPYTTMKDELLADMEEKYLELMDEGISEGEAVRTVITEFGNIEELLDSLEEDYSTEIRYAEPGVHVLSRDEGYAYLQAKKSAGRFTGFGVFLCIMGAAFSMLFASISESINMLFGFWETFGVVILLIMVACAVGLFIYASRLEEPYKKLKKNIKRQNIVLDRHFEATLEEQYNGVKSTCTVATIIGVMLCVLSPLPTIITASFNFSGFFETFPVFILMLMVAVAVYLFVSYNSIEDSYKTLLGKK